MSLTERHYERVARWMDGERIELTEPEQAVARELQDGQALLARRLDAPMPPTAMHKARRRLIAELARPSRWALRIRHTAMAAAASFLIAFGLVHLILSHKGYDGLSSGGVSMETPVDVDLAIMDLQLQELEQDISSSRSGGLDLQMEEMQEQIDNFLQGDPGSPPDEG